jgi:hypothetical protein
MEPFREEWIAMRRDLKKQITRLRTPSDMTAACPATIPETIDRIERCIKELEALLKLHAV